MTQQIQIKGLAELQAALDTLPAKIQANIMRGALRAGAKVMATAAKDAVPVRTGNLKSTIRVGTRNQGHTAMARIIAGRVGVKGKASGFYAHMVEFGTAAHRIEAKPGSMLAIGYRAVNHPGAKPQPFMRPALDNNAQAALAATREYVRTRLATKHGLDVPAPLEDGDE